MYLYASKPGQYVTTDILVYDADLNYVKTIQNPYGVQNTQTSFTSTDDAWFVTQRGGGFYPASVYRIPNSEPISTGTEIWRYNSEGWFTHPVYDADYLYAASNNEGAYPIYRQGRLMKYAKSDGSHGAGIQTPGSNKFYSICLDDTFIYMCGKGGGDKYFAKYTKDLELVLYDAWPYSPTEDGAADGSYLYMSKGNCSGMIFLCDKSTMQQIVPADSQDNTVGGVTITNLPRLIQDDYYGYFAFMNQTNGYLYMFWVAWDSGYQEHWYPIRIPCADIVNATGAGGEAEYDKIASETGTWMMNLIPDGLSFPAIAVTPPSFEESREELEGRGYLAIYIDRLTESIKVFESINEAIGSYLYSGYDGKYRYRAFVQKSAEGLMQFTDDEIFSYKERIASEELFSFFRTEYAYRREQDYPQVYLEERKSVQYLAGSPIQINREVRVPFTQREDAQYYTQRAAVMYGQRLLLATVEVAPKAWTLEPADFIQMTYTRGGINAVFEVLEVERDMNRGIVTLTLGNQHGLSGGPGAGDPGGGSTDPGIWMAESPAFPGSLGGGSMEFWDKNWSAEQKAYARQNAGFWCEETGFADATDPEAKDPSTWT